MVIYLPEISEEVTESVILEYDLKPNRAEIQLVVHELLKSFSILSTIFALTFQVHAAYVAHKLIGSLEGGLELAQQDVILMLPLNVLPVPQQTRIQYETPLLHGQGAVIPVAFR